MATTSRFLVTQFFPGALLIALALAAGVATTGAQSPNPDGTLRLADGTPFTAKIVRVDEEWVEVDRDGWRMQLPWWAVDGALLAEKRRESLDTKVPSSVAEYARWAHWQGLTSERDTHAATAAAAGAAPNLERRLPDWYIQRLPAAQQPVVEAPDPEPEARPDPPPQRDPSRPAAPRRPKPESVTIKPAKNSGETKSLAEAVSAKVTGQGTTVKASGGAVTVTVGEVTLTTVKRVTWFGAIHELIKNGSFELKVTWPDGHSKTETFKSSNHMTRRSDAEVDEKVRNDLAGQADSWLKREVLRD